MKREDVFWGEPVTLRPIAWIRSCYPERFGIPRQPGLVPSAHGEIVFAATEPNRLALRDLEDCSHLWVVFWFHGQTFPNKGSPLVRPPRLGGRKTRGVYGTRSPNRPNPLGLSAVRLEGVEIRPHEIVVKVGGGDFLDGTPVLDIKPYVPYSDAIPEAKSPWGTEPLVPVVWSGAAAGAWQALAPGEAAGLRRLVEETLQQDPRPAHERGKDGKPGQTWGMRILRFQVVWKVEGGVAEVVDLYPDGLSGPSLFLEG